MIRSKLDEAIGLTRDMLERYWQHDYEYALSLMDPDIVWIGANPNQEIQGLMEVRADLQKVDLALISCHLNAQEYRIIHHTRTSCSIAGKYLVTTDPGTGAFLQVWQRCFAIWQMDDQERLWLKGLHVSNPLGELNLAEGEIFPNHLGRQAYQYLMQNVNNEKNGQKFMIMDMDGVTHFLYDSEIELVEANRHIICIHLEHGKIICRYSITTFCQEHAEVLVRVQRSYAVNPMRISHVTGNRIFTDCGHEIPIPVKKKVEIMNEISGKISKS